MSKDNVISLPNPAVKPVLDPLTEILQQGARRLLAEAVEAEVERFLEQHREQRDKVGRQRLVRNGHLPPRTLQTGIGGIEVEYRECGIGGSAGGTDPVHLRDYSQVPA